MFLYKSSFRIFGFRAFFLRERDLRDENVISILKDAFTSTPSGRSSGIMVRMIFSRAELLTKCTVPEAGLTSSVWLSVPGK